MANQASYTFRFGTLKSVDVQQSDTGTPYARFAIDAGKFTAYGVAFDAGIIAAMAETEVGEKVRVGGYVDTNVVQGEGGEKRFQNLVARWFRVGEAEPVKIAPKGETDIEITPDDFTKIKGIGPKADASLKALGILTFAQLAATTETQRAALDAEVNAVKGAFVRNDVFGQAEAFAA